MPDSIEQDGLSTGRKVVANGEGRFQVLDRELLDILELTTTRGGLSVDQVIEKAILNEALIEEQVRHGRRWQIRDERDRTADVDFA